MTTIQETLDARGKIYGEFATHAIISQALKQAMWLNSPNWFKLPADTREALEMIQHKIARILNGDPEYDDNFRDLAGYSQLVLNRILRGKKGSQP